MAGAAEEVDLSYVMDPEEEVKAEQVITRAFKIWNEDLDDLEKIDKYVRGIQAGPYTPRQANQEYKLLIERSMTNMLDLIIRTPAQSLFAEGYRTSALESSSTSSTETTSGPPTTAWGIWQRNGMDRRQGPLFYDALKFGFAGGVVEAPGAGPKSKANKRVYDYPRFHALDPMKTVALYFDPINDDRPAVIWTLDVAPGDKMGRGRLWDQTNWYQFEIDTDGKASIKQKGTHGFLDCPGVIFAARRDLQGRTSGIVEHLFDVQDRLNQTVFDLLVAQSYGSFKVRYATGMVPPPQRQRVPVTIGEIRALLEDDHPLKNAPSADVYGYRMDVVVDADGNPVPQAVTADITRFLVAEDKDTSFGTLESTELGGFIESIGMSLSHLATLSQLPPHYLLGNLANLSADALAVAESSLARMVQEFQHSFGEALEQIMSLFMEAVGQEPDWMAEIQWRDMSPRSFAAVVDGLGKMAESLQVPLKGLWARVPGVTASELDTWTQLSDELKDNYEDQPEANGARALQMAAEASAAARGGAQAGASRPAATTQAPKASRDRNVESGVSSAA
jgi:hypothetical protein